ncbi:hypothetical protein [Gemmobacter denitrificans]|uniref:PH (Pleckstrin Homology) domain-containing protein n=1 Tax=Gemmobacter denitrificans TaxID=3123040 RepID=A0ABU8BWS3_9RHOB
MTPLPGETLLWEGRALPGLRPRIDKPANILFGLAMIAFALFWMDRALRDGGIMWLAGLPFLGFGLRMAVVPVWGPRIAARLSRYALTDRRALIETRWPLIGSRWHSMTITPATLVDADGSPMTLTLRSALAGPRGTADETLIFHRLDDGAEVLALIRQIQRNTAGGAP